MCGHHVVLGTIAKIDHASLRGGSHLGDERVCSIEHRGAVALHRLDDDLLDLSQVFERVNPIHPEMVSADVRHNRYVTVVEC